MDGAGVFAAQYVIVPVVIGLLGAALVIATGTWMTAVLRDEYEQSQLGELADVDDEDEEVDDDEDQRDGTQAPAGAGAVGAD